MMRFFILMTLLFPMWVQSKPEVWNVSELRRRFEVKGEVFVLGANGKNVLHKTGLWNLWKTQDKTGVIANLWTSNSNYAPLAIQHRWQVLDDGTIQVLIEQFSGAEAGNTSGKEKLGKLVKKEEKILENLEAVTVVTLNDKDHRVVVRFTPGFSDGDVPKAISEVPIAGTDVMMTDNEGFVWANHLTMECKYCGFLTSRGTLFLSYYPFQGGKEIGIASGEEIEVRLSDKKIITLRSKSHYLPSSVNAIVYGSFYPDRKQGKFPSAGVMGRSEAKDFADAISHWPN